MYKIVMSNDTDMPTNYQHYYTDSNGHNKLIDLKVIPIQNSSFYKIDTESNKTKF